jgi:hypothetical protein
VVVKWATQLETGGLLLAEEAETIRTLHPVFSRYLAVVEPLLASQSNLLYAGRLIAHLDARSGLKSIFNELRSPPIQN